MTRSLTKAQIRNTCLKKRKGLDPRFIRQASEKIADSIQNLSCYQKAQRLAGYFSIGGEVDLNLLWKISLEKNKSCYFPVIQANHSLIFAPYTLNTELKLNCFNILEPKILEKITVQTQMDIIFLPMVAFDNRGMRLGMGKGYYDKTLPLYPKALLIGVAYEWQKQTQLPCDPWDVKVDMVITEEKMYF